jgi:uncharacterized protein (TIGR03437 family)
MDSGVISTAVTLADDLLEAIRTRFGLTVMRVAVVLAVSAAVHGRATAQPMVSAVVNAASYAGGAVSRGETVVVLGTGLGPPNLISRRVDAAGKAPSSLAGVIVTFNGVPSPLMYVSASRIRAIVPYELAGLTAAEVRVNYGNATSAAVTVRVVAATPGIFSADESGAGNAAAINADGSINSPDRPAQPGSSVTFTLTGDGDIAYEASGVNAPLAVTIAGLPAQVLHAGKAPREAVGLTQVRALVPSALPYGGSVSLFVRIGNVTSQPGLTIAVAGPPAPSSLVADFSPNATTISTSEGAPYGDCDFWVKGPSSCGGESNFGYGPTKVVRLYICLSGEMAIESCSQNPMVTGPLPTAMLNGIDSGIAAYGGTGIRLIIRFTYNYGPIGPGAMDAPIDVISTHIDQLAPVLLRNKDLIFALEAGFIGTWGEWHDSTSGNDTADDHKALLDKELSYFSGSFPILVRHPGVLIAYTGTSKPRPALGIHDDYYASNADDATTWKPCVRSEGYCLANLSQSQIMSYAAEVSTTAVFAGEFGAVYPPLQTCAALDAYSSLLHPQSISLYPYPATVGTELQSEGCAASFYNQVGTRIVLERAAISGNPTPGGRLSVTLTMANAGYGRVIRQRPVTFVLMQKGQTVAQIWVPLEKMDLRTLQSFMDESFEFELTLPATLGSGPVSAALLIPDPAPSLSRHPAYALPLNSVNRNGNPIFDPASGYNFIGDIEP